MQHNPSTETAEPAVAILKQGVVPSGPGHRAALLAFAGVDAIRPEAWRQLGNAVYERPSWGATLLDNGTVLVQVQRSLDAYYYLLADRAAFEAWRRQRLGRVADPETGRAR